MGLTDARKQAIECLRNGSVEHEARDNIDEKNLLLTGVLTIDQVIKILNCAKGLDYSSTPHKDSKEIEVHIFKPKAKLEGESKNSNWYIKFYFVDPGIMFISVHKSSRGLK